jgi:hypothetical protein
MFGQPQDGAEGASQRYAPGATTPRLGKQTRKTGNFFAGNRLRPLLKHFPMMVRE